MAGRRRVSWDDDNRRHLFIEHAERGITQDQVTFAVENATNENVAPDLKHGTIVGLCRLSVGFSPLHGSREREGGAIQCMRIGPGDGNVGV
jgi:hypothetical protein